VLSEKLGLPFTNLGTNAAGNQFIANSILDHSAADPTKDRLYVIAWSHWGRYDFCDAAGKMVHLTHNSRLEKDFTQRLFTDFFNERYLYKKYINQILFLQAWFRDKNADYLMLDALAGIHNGNYISDPVTRALTLQIDRSKFIGFGVKSFDSMTDSKERLLDGHPNAAAHQQMADILHRELVNRYGDIT
jgi:lysophospholipase L1-like esterase